jgi:hypothetical protein
VALHARTRVHISEVSITTVLSTRSVNSNEPLVITFSTKVPITVDTLRRASFAYSVVS